MRQTKYRMHVISNLSKFIRQITANCLSCVVPWISVSIHLFYSKNYQRIKTGESRQGCDGRLYSVVMYNRPQSLTGPVAYIICYYYVFGCQWQELSPSCTGLLYPAWGKIQCTINYSQNKSIRQVTSINCNINSYKINQISNLLLQYNSVQNVWSWLATTNPKNY